MVVLIAVLGSGAAAVFWIARQHDGAGDSASDCKAVVEVALEWRSVGAADNAAAMQAGGVENPDGWAALGAKSRHAEELVSSTEIKRNLSVWADGFTEFADIARNSANGSEDARFKHFVDVTNKLAKATDALQAACPDIAVNGNGSS